MRYLDWPFDLKVCFEGGWGLVSPANVDGWSHLLGVLWGILSKHQFELKLTVITFVASHKSLLYLSFMITFKTIKQVYFEIKGDQELRLGDFTKRVASFENINCLGNIQI